MNNKLQAERAGKLREALDRVFDERSFVDFLSALAGDWSVEREIEAAMPSIPYSIGALRWENGTIGAFLGAAGAWAEASKNGLQFYVPPGNPWRRAADILMAGKSYE